VEDAAICGLFPKRSANLRGEFLVADLEAARSSRAGAHFQGSREFKIAEMKDTFAFPFDPWFNFDDPPLLLALIFLVVGFARNALRKS
jgi:hypothetical protein